MEYFFYLVIQIASVPQGHADALCQKMFALEDDIVAKRKTRDYTPLWEACDMNLMCRAAHSKIDGKCIDAL